MKKILLSAASLLVAGTFLLSSCKKKEDITPDDSVTTSEATISSTSTNDNNNVDSDIDDVMNDISLQLDGSASSGRLDESTDCGVSSVTISGANKKVKLTYDGTYCLFSNAKKSGTIIITLTSGTDFSEKGAQFTVEYQGYAVTSGGKTLTLTGTHFVTNLTGGLPRYVLTRSSEYSSVEVDITGKMTINFDTTATAREWQVARNIIYGNTDGVLSSTISGSATADGYANLVTWGTNRFGEKFYNQITTPIVSTSKCGFRRPIAGERVHTLVFSDASTITNTVEVTTGTDGCGSGIKITIKNRKGKEKQVTLSID